MKLTTGTTMIAADFCQNITNILQQIKAVKKIYVAYSGGVDSQVLLHLAKQYCQPTPIEAIHIHHGLQRSADAFEIFCKNTCQQLNLACHVLRVQVNLKQGLGLEASARRARLQALENFIDQDSLLLFAHHQDDQAETVLLQLLRGAGVQGLSAMPLITNFGSGFLARPLLTSTRDAVLRYANENQFTWIDDPSNQDIHFDRNYLRQQIMPLIKQRWPQASKTIARCSQHCSEIMTFVKESLQDQFADCITQQNSLDLVKLKDLNVEKQKAVIRYWLANLQLTLPSSVQLTQILQTVIQAKEDAMPKFTWGNNEIRRYQQQLYAFEQFQTPLADFSQAFNWQDDIQLPAGLGILGCVQKFGQGINEHFLKQIKTLTVRFRQTGERFHPQGRAYSHPLKKLMQEWQIPPWQRSCIPLLYAEDKLIAVVGYAVHNDVAVKAEEWGWVYVSAG